jgi:ABC-type bacteriocin/lantibiotic exporter with double-glycine peptidase domain
MDTSSTRLKRALRQLRGAGDELWNRLSDLTGYAAIRLPLQRASGHGEVTLDLPGYQQLDNYSCGAVAVAMVVKSLKPAMGFERIYAAVNPHREYGTATSRAIRAMSALGIRVSRKQSLRFDDICTAIDAGRPVMVCVTTSEKGTDHWVVIYGYGRRPNLVFVAGQGWPFIVRHRMKWREFRRRWSPAGEGLVCWKASRRNARPSPRPAQKK